MGLTVSVGAGLAPKVKGNNEDCHHLKRKMSTQFEVDILHIFNFKHGILGLIIPTITKINYFFKASLNLVKY